MAEPGGAGDRQPEAGLHARPQRRRHLPRALAGAGSGVNRCLRESARVVSGDVPQKGVAWCSLDSRLLLSSLFARSPPLKLPSLNADLYRLPTGPGSLRAGEGRGREARGGGPLVLGKGQKGSKIESVKIHYFCRGPISVDPICPQRRCSETMQEVATFVFHQADVEAVGFIQD